MTQFFVRLNKPKKNQPVARPQEWYEGGYHVFETLNEARADAIRMYLKGWRSGLSYAANDAFFGKVDSGRKLVQGVGVQQSKYSVCIGFVVRSGNQFYWVPNKNNGKKVALNMDGSLRKTVKKKENDYGIKGNWRPFGL